jgi:mono/diheme cytochrome c family protein
MKAKWFAAIALAMSLFIVTVTAQSQDSPANLTGNAERGKTLYITAFRCASCHGTTAESGSPRLVPVRRTQADFIAFVQKPTVQAMPAYGDQPAQALADVYAYLKSIPATTPPPVQSIPILYDVLKTIP